MFDSLGNLLRNKKNTLYLLKQNYALEIKLDGGVGIFVRISGELFLTKK